MDAKWENAKPATKVCRCDFEKTLPSDPDNQSQMVDAHVWWEKQQYLVDQNFRNPWQFDDKQYIVGQSRHNQLQV